MKHVLIVMVAGGGGHGSVARAIEGALGSVCAPDTAVHIVDLSKESDLAPVRRLDDLYRWMSQRRSPLYRVLWATGGAPWLPGLLAPVLAPLFHDTVARVLDATTPDLIVSVHGLTNHLPLRIVRRRLGLSTPFVTVVTDMVTTHPIWYCPDVDRCLVPTEEARQRGVRFGMPPAKIEVVGQPIDLAFSLPAPDRWELYEQLGLDPARRSVLIVGGGDGVGPVLETARALDRRVPGLQILIVAGNNAALQRRLQDQPWLQPVHVYGFVHNMSALMHASDILVTKAGPGTIAEAFAVGLPLVLFDHIPGQEEGNVRYVLEHRAGVYERDPGRIAETIGRWLGPARDEMAALKANSTSCARPDAAAVIARRLCELMNGVG